MDKDFLWLVATGTAYILGVATGILVVKDQMERKYKRIAQEEIDSVKETFARRKETASVEKKELAEEAYIPAPRENGYSDVEDRPYVIPPEEFGDLADYDTISLTYFADGVLTDESGYPVDDADDAIGPDALTHFGEYEEDSVFVRNNARKCDYEILLDHRRYCDVRGTMPPM